ncbi:hypothetical protein ABZY45_24410 [Streptomyces sp. NPDC006516]|uniref:hypothetical protein n=1 Tax=Streptomyces sp. NPDC006516 TaxID=3154309 RepID=UPI00339FC4E7
MPAAHPAPALMHRDDLVPYADALLDNPVLRWGRGVAGGTLGLALLFGRDPAAGLFELLELDSFEEAE